jgi:hydroxymethylglutaryl-CoA lyase
LAALETGIDSFESSTEDVASMLHEMGVDTGIDLERLIEASRNAQEVLGRPLGAHVLRAGPVDWHRS